MAGKHTAGPWYPTRNSAGYWEVMTVRDHDFMTGDPQSFVGYAHGASICSGIGDHTESRTRGNEYENARLIAAAPDLLTACELALQYWYSDHPNDTQEAHEARDKIRAAIARATQPLPPPNEDAP